MAAHILLTDAENRECIGLIKNIGDRLYDDVIDAIRCALGDHYDISVHDNPIDQDTIKVWYNSLYIDTDFTIVDEDSNDHTVNVQRGYIY